jgi:hypothetical protein
MPYTEFERTFEYDLLFKHFGDSIHSSTICHAAASCRGRAGYAL